MHNFPFLDGHSPLLSLRNMLTGLIVLLTIAFSQSDLRFGRNFCSLNLNQFSIIDLADRDNTELLSVFAILSLNPFW